MNILISGANGFIGRHVVDSIAGNHNLALILRNLGSQGFKPDNVTNIIGSLENIAEVQKEIINYSPDACIHLAWDGIPDFSAKRSLSNLNLSVSLLDMLIENTNCKKYIITGSCYEYGNASGECRESDPAKFDSFIGWAKHSINQYATLRCLEKGLKLYWLRCFYVFGSGQRNASIIPSIISAFLKNETPIIKNPFNPNDFVHVKDISRAIRLILERDPEGGIYNLGSGQATQIVKICEIIERKICNSTTFSDSLLNLNKDMHSRGFWADITKAKKYFGWEPYLTIEEGIEELLGSIKREMRW